MSNRVHQTSSRSSTHILRNKSELINWRDKHRGEIAFVPTMGYLHEGHLSLIRTARQHARYVIVSIFVNPTQFNDPQDFERYPRNEEGDISVALSAGADAIFLPTPEVIYPNGAQTRVNVGSLADSLCGATRPGHFEGVCTVVMALFQLTQCNVALFGEKDYQQLAIIRQMTRDLHLPIKIVGCSTSRETDGLAMSSRNARLSSSARQDATSIYQGLTATQQAWKNGERSIKTLKNKVLERLPTYANIDYLSICDPNTLVPYPHEQVESQRALIAIACYFEDVRLIDNLILE